MGGRRSLIRMVLYSLHCTHCVLCTVCIYMYMYIKHSTAYTHCLMNYTKATLVRIHALFQCWSPASTTTPSHWKEKYFPVAKSNFSCALNWMPWFKSVSIIIYVYLCMMCIVVCVCEQGIREPNMLRVYGRIFNKSTSVSFNHSINFSSHFLIYEERWLCRIHKTVENFPTHTDIDQHWKLYRWSGMRPED